WFDWSLVERHADVRRFVKSFIAFRGRRDVATEASPPTLDELLRRARIEWHGVALHRPDWDERSHSLAFTMRSVGERYLVHGMLNAYWERLPFEVPAPPPDSRQGWRRWVDTALASPDDIRPWDEAPSVTQSTYDAQPRSVVFLVLPLPGGGDGPPVRGDS